MKIVLHLLGGAGRIGTALIQSLVDNPISNLDSIYVYCDSTKANGVERLYANTKAPFVRALGYSGFVEFFESEEHSIFSSENTRHVVFNLRGINKKQQWLNQPLDSMGVQINSCRTIVDANLWLHSNVEIIHFSSLLCDLIESPLSLDQICEGQESYRRPYMVSRLHQETMLAANAFQHSISTCFLRLPAVYGFSDDAQSPWVLNVFCKCRKKKELILSRNPSQKVYLTHCAFLIQALRLLISSDHDVRSSKTVSYMRPPMLGMPVGALANIVENYSIDSTDMQWSDLGIEFLDESNLGSGDNIDAHMLQLLSAIDTLIKP